VAQLPWFASDWADGGSTIVHPAGQPEGDAALTSRAWSGPESAREAWSRQARSRRLIVARATVVTTAA
jgi:hypothetical protein